MPRRYRQVARHEAAGRTRRALLEACEALLLEGPVEDATLPAVAARAGVTKPTAYRHFPTGDALMAGFLDHIRERIGMGHEALSAAAPAALPGVARANYQRYEAHARLMRRVMDSPSYERVRRARSIDRPGLALPAWRAADAAATDDELRVRLGALYLLVTPSAWRWLRDTWGLDRGAARDAASWAVGVLAAALLPPPTTIPPPSSNPRPRRSPTDAHPPRHDPGARASARGRRPRRAAGGEGDPPASPAGKPARVRR
jgi:AcrR family transcriptional regulator